MTFDIWNEDWGLHIASADAQTQKLNYCSRASLQHVINSEVDVGVRLMISENGLWHMEGQRTQHWITVAAAHIRFSCCFFWFFCVCVTRQILVPAPTFLSWFIFIFSQPAWFWQLVWRWGAGANGEDRGGKVIFFESENVELLSAFLVGVVQKQLAGDHCLLHLIATEAPK